MAVVPVMAMVVPVMVMAVMVVAKEEVVMMVMAKEEVVAMMVVAKEPMMVVMVVMTPTHLLHHACRFRRCDFERPQHARNGRSIGRCHRHTNRQRQRGD